MHANSYKSNCLMLTSCAHETSIPIVCESLFPLTFIARWIVSHTHQEPNRTRHWLWTDGSPFTKPPASIGMLNIAVFICHYCTPQSVSMGPARWVTAPSKSLKTSLAFSPQLHLLPFGPALGPWHQRGSARDALQTPHTRLGGNEWLDSHFCTIWEPPTGLLMPGWK